MFKPLCTSRSFPMTSFDKKFCRVPLPASQTKLKVSVFLLHTELLFKPAHCYDIQTHERAKVLTHALEFLSVVMQYTHSISLCIGIIRKKMCRSVPLLRQHFETVPHTASLIEGQELNETRYSCNQWHSEKNSYASQ